MRNYMYNLNYHAAVLMSKWLYSLRFIIVVYMQNSPPDIRVTNHSIPPAVQMWSDYSDENKSDDDDDDDDESPLLQNSIPGKQICDQNTALQWCFLFVQPP